MPYADLVAVLVCRVVRVWIRGFVFAPASINLLLVDRLFVRETCCRRRRQSSKGTALAKFCSRVRPLSNIGSQQADDLRCSVARARQCETQKFIM
jgi:hypothetical protein